MAAALPALGQKGMDRVLVKHLTHDLEITRFDDPAWKQARPVTIQTYWSGEAAPAARGFTARLLWSDAALYVRFEAEQHEPLIVSEKPDLTQKVRGLWDRDVCEVFIAPERATPNRYFEFEVAPSGEWIDLAIEITPEKRVTDWDYSSAMRAAARLEGSKVIEVIKIPFAALGRVPIAGDLWLGNLFRCVGSGPTRGYLAWRPTRTKTPDFHVPDAFGEFRFL